MTTLEQGQIVQRLMEEHVRAAEAVERAAYPALRTEIQHIVAELEVALATFYVAPDRFGVCTDCGEPVGIERLELMPWARQCLRCALAREMTPAEA